MIQAFSPTQVSATKGMLPSSIFPVMLGAGCPKKFDLADLASMTALLTDGALPNHLPSSKLT
jgi:hypothetical protein